MFNYDEIDFEVEKVSLYNPHRDGWSELPSDIGVGLRRKDNQQMLGIVSEDYFPVQYAEIVSGVEEALRKSGLDMTDADFTTKVHESGAKLELRAKFPAHEVTVPGDNSTIIPEFCFRTSHNRTWANNGMMGLWRNKCYNTLVNGDKLAYVYGRHTKNFNVDGFAAKVKAAGEYIVGDGVEKMRHWFDTPVTRDQAVALFTDTLAQRTDNVTGRKVANKVMLSNLMRIFDEENRHLHDRGNYAAKSYSRDGTLWSAYQAGTWWSSHPGDSSRGKKHTVKVTREDKVRKMVNSYRWRELEIAA